MSIFAAITYKGQNCSKDGMYDSAEDLIQHLNDKKDEISEVVLQDEGDVVFDCAGIAAAYVELWLS